MLTQARLKELFSYNQETGVFIRLVRIGIRGLSGKQAGNLNPNGYRHIKIDYLRYAEHRLAWLYVTGAWPNDEVDHINGIRSDNRWCNLRDVTRQVNGQNQRKPMSHNKTGFLGVIFDKSKSYYRAAIKVNGKRIYFGPFDTALEAHQEYLAKKRLHHKGCTI